MSLFAPWQPFASAPGTASHHVEMEDVALDLRYKPATHELTLTFREPLVLALFDLHKVVFNLILQYKTRHFYM